MWLGSPSYSSGHDNTLLMQYITVYDSVIRRAVFILSSSSPRLSLWPLWAIHFYVEFRRKWYFPMQNLLAQCYVLSSYQGFTIRVSMVWVVVCTIVCSLLRCWWLLGWLPGCCHAVATVFWMVVSTLICNCFPFDAVFRVLVKTFIYCC